MLPTKAKPKSKQKLINGIQRFWEQKVDAKKCCKYISHLKKVLPVVVVRQGRASGY